MTSSNWYIFRVTGPFWRESVGHRRFPSQRPVTSWANRDASDLRRLCAHYDLLVMCLNRANDIFKWITFMESLIFCPCTFHGVFAINRVPIYGMDWRRTGQDITKGFISYKLKWEINICGFVRCVTFMESNIRISIIWECLIKKSNRRNCLIGI